MKKKKILVIDDFQPLLEEVIDFLNIEGFMTYSAKNGAEGVQTAIQYKPDLIICDIEMPQMNGFEVFKTLEKIPATESIPFIFLTARAQADDYKTGLKIGADDYITKPLEMDHLLNTVLKRLNKHDRLKQKHRKEFEALINNPLVGIFIYKTDRIILTNKKTEEITSYSKNELNNLNYENLIVGDYNILKAKFNKVLNNIHESDKLRVSLVNKEKKAVFIDLFIKYVEIENENALIGLLVEIPSSSHSAEVSNPEFDKLIRYMLDSGKEKLAEEIINVKNIIEFSSETETKKLKLKIKLTKRETEILKLICEGYSNVEIAEKLFISNRTVDNHRANLLSKTGSRNTASLVAFAVSKKLVSI